jgi:hypothetical protein
MIFLYLQLASFRRGNIDRSPRPCAKTRYASVRSYVAPKVRYIFFVVGYSALRCQTHIAACGHLGIHIVGSGHVLFLHDIYTCASFPNNLISSPPPRLFVCTLLGSHKHELVFLSLQIVFSTRYVREIL